MDRFYELPTDAPVLVNLSGGRSSAYMLRMILDHHNGLPGNCHVCFQNTGCEHPATYEFINEIATRWDVKITWLEFFYDTEAKGGVKDPKYLHKVVDYETADRDSKPFKDLLIARNTLPSQNQRFCTTELKLFTVKRYMVRDLGIKKWYVVLGIRSDEQKRFLRIQGSSSTLKHEYARLMPMVYAGVTKQTVADFWSRNDFDLALDSNMTNCMFCFMKTTGLLKNMIKMMPEDAAKWAELENDVMARSNTKSMYYYSQMSLQDMIDSVDKQPELNFVSDGWDGVDCYCGD